MAFDACMLACVITEINNVGAGGRIEKVYQPERDEIIFQMRTTDGGKRLLINGGSNNPRIHFTSVQKENPAQAPMFCMLLRKHLTGSTLASVEQMGFERVAKLTFNARDEMGFDCKKYIIAEVMGKYSNLIFADENMRIISSLKTVDFTTSSLRQVLPGMTYELPPIQDKLDPTKTERAEFLHRFSSAPPQSSAQKFITANYLGISTSLARQMVYSACNDADATLDECDANDLYTSFSNIFCDISAHIIAPTLIYDNDTPVEYCFTPLTYFGSGSKAVRFNSLSELLDTFFEDRDKENRIKQHAADILRMLTSAESRLIKKLELQHGELADCDKGVQYKKYGDLISSNMYKLSKKEKRVEVID